MELPDMQTFQLESTADHQNKSLIPDIALFFVVGSNKEDNSLGVVVAANWMSALKAPRSSAWIQNSPLRWMTRYRLIYKSGNQLLAGCLPRLDK